MSRFFVILVLIKGLLLATIIDKVEVDGVEIPLILEEDKRLPIVSMQIVFLASGSITDGANAGLASLSAELLEEGSSKKGAVGFARELEKRAIHLATTAGKESFVFELSALKEQFDSGADLLLELFADPNLNKKTVDKIKNQRVSLIKRKESDFDFVASRGLDSIMYANSVLQNPNIGTVESIEKISLKDIENFLKTTIVKHRAVVLFGGDIDSKKAKSLTQKLLSKLPDGEKNDLVRVELKKNTKIEKIKKDTEQAYIYFGSPFFMNANDDESYKATVASYILGGGGFGSRIMEEVRVKRGYAYSAYARVSLGLSSSRFKGYLQTKLDSQDDAIKVVKSVISEFVKNGITETELNDAKEFLLGSEPLRTETMSQRLSRSFNDFYRGKKIGWSKEQLEKIESLTLSEINSFIKQHNEIEDLAIFIVTK